MTTTTLDPVTLEVIRNALPAVATFGGPAIVQEHGTDTIMFVGDRCTVAGIGDRGKEVNSTR